MRKKLRVEDELLRSFRSAAVLAVALIILPAALAPQICHAEDESDQYLPVTRMVNPAIDNEGPWCYLAKPSTQLAVVGAPQGAQITFDGAINTGGIELVLLHGEPLRPCFARQKTFLDGWIPVVQYGWREGPIRYDVEAFAAEPEGPQVLGTVIFVKVVVRNDGAAVAWAPFGVTTRYSGLNHRFEGLKTEPFSPDWAYEMTDDALIRDGKVVLLYPAGGAREAVPDVPYKVPFKGRLYHVSERAEVGLVRYSKELTIAKTQSFVFKIPCNPVPVGNEKALSALRAADYEKLRTQTIEWWKTQLSRGARFTIPEEKVQQAHRASLVFPMQAIREEKDGWVQCVNKFQYNHFWLRDAAYIIHAYDVLGQHDVARRVLNVYPRYQRPDGNFESQKGQLDGFGQALYALGQHALITGDADYARQIWPYYPKAVAWLRQARAADPLGLMPRTDVRDNEFIVGHYTGHNFWALLGLRTAVRVARLAGHENEAAEFEKDYQAYEAQFLKQLSEVTGSSGPIPPGLDVKGGQDWGNLIGVFPAEVLAPNDQRLAATLEKMHREKFAEGLMTYMGRLHHYLTVKEAQNHIARGEQEQALRDFYAILLHMDSTHAMFEWQAEPWGDRDVGGNYPPHGWGAAMFNLMLRNMLVREAGGRGGLEPRDLHLFSVVSPEWGRSGATLGVEGAPTEAGPITALMRFSEAGATIEIEYPAARPVHWDFVPKDAEVLEEPAEEQAGGKWPLARSIVVHIPYWAELSGFRADVEPLEQFKDRLVFPPSVRRVSLTWRKRAVQPMSFERTVEEFKRDYKQRYASNVTAGGSPVHLDAPPLLSASERRRLFRARYESSQAGIAVGKPVTSSAPSEEGHPPRLAVDGDARDRDASCWWAPPPAPQWLQIDLEEPREINAVHVFPYWDGSRYYQYVVDVSLDGEIWRRVADRSAATDPETPFGHRHEFAPVRARYVRVTMLYNSANPSMHLVEVRVYPVEKTE
ncbi:MAG: hypothetical protein Kow0059_10670 [Candidatus Sumerlaeia bacterium]